MARIALLARALDRPGGAEKSMLTLKRHLEQTHGHRVHLFGIGSGTQSNGERTAVPLLFRRRLYVPAAVGRLGRYTEGFLRFYKKVRRFNPDIVISQHELALVGARLRSIEQVSHILLFRDFEMCGQTIEADRHPVGKAAEKTLWPITYPLVNYIIQNTDVAIANSQFISKTYKNEWNIDSEVIYPFVEIEDYNVSGAGDQILHVTPTKEKGIDITMGVAEQLPDIEFLVVGGKVTSEIKHQMSKHINVTYMGYCEDMRTIYRQTKLTLMPSRWNEPFGRIPIESGASGIPTVCSNSGGLPEAAGINELVVDSENPNDYTTVVELALNNYGKFRDLARKNAERKRASVELQKFDRVLKSIQI